MNNSLSKTLAGRGLLAFFQMLPLFNAVTYDHTSLMVGSTGELLAVKQMEGIDTHLVPLVFGGEVKICNGSECVQNLGFDLRQSEHPCCDEESWSDWERREDGMRAVRGKECVKKRGGAQRRHRRCFKLVTVE